MEKLISALISCMVPALASVDFGSPGTFLGMQRDADAEAVVADLYQSIGLHSRIYVVIHPGARGCAYASVAGGQQFVGYDPACLGPLRSGDHVEWRALNILGHECGHLLQGHVLNAAHSHREELEADEWAGFAMAKRNATLDQAQAAFRSFPEAASKTHPGRELRLAAVERGFKRGRVGMTPAQTAAFADTERTKLVGRSDVEAPSLGAMSDEFRRELRGGSDAW